MEVNWNAVKKNYKKSSKRSSQPYDIMFPTSHNIIYEEPFFSACTIVLKKLLESGNTILVTIKPFFNVVKQICTLFSENRDNLTFRFTIGSSDTNILKILEINGPSFEERLKSLKYATNNGFNTSISIEPLLDFYPYELIEKLEPFLSTLDFKKDIGTIWIGLLKTKYIPNILRKGKIKKFLDDLKPTLQFNHVFQYYKELYNNPRIKWKESIIKMMILNDVKVKNFS